MTDLAPQTQNAQLRALEGIACIVAGMICFVVQDGMMKSLLKTYPIWMLIAARGVMACLILGPAIVRLGAPHRLLTPLWPLHLMRAILFASGFALYYAAFPFMNLAEISTLFFSAPLMIGLLAAAWLGETIGPHRIGALAVGFTGVVIAMNPTSDAFHWIAIFPLLCAASYAVSQVLARRIGDRETTLTTGLYTIALSGMFIVPAGWIVNQLVPLGEEFHHLRWAWPALSAIEALRLALLGTIGMVGYMLLSRAYQITSASIVAPFDYSYLPFATAMAYVVWGEVPKLTTLAGMGLIVAAGLYLGYRELRSSRRRTEPAPVAEAVIAPGNPNAVLSLAADIEDDPDAPVGR